MINVFLFEYISEMQFRDYAWVHVLLCGSINEFADYPFRKTHFLLNWVVNLSYAPWHAYHDESVNYLSMSMKYNSYQWIPAM